MSDVPLRAIPRLALTWQVWAAYAMVILGTRGPLPDRVARLGRVPPRGASRHSPARLGRAIDRALRVGSRHPTCLRRSLTLLRLLRRQGDSCDLVIGLRSATADRTAHAWIEIDGIDVGPPPGRGDYVELARFR